MKEHSTDILAFDQAMVTQPVWNKFDTASDAVDLPENFLLHAGPDFQSIEQITIPIMNSACVAAVYEGLAQGFEEAHAMIVSGEIQLKSAQDFSVVTPLAAVVSASMPLHSVYDAWGGEIRAFAPINGGSRPAMRLGLLSDAVLAHIRWLNTRFLDVLEAGLAEGIPLVPLAAKGLGRGDDCHGRTPVSGAALVQELIDRTNGGIADEDAIEFMHSSPSLFLNLWMAATKCMMKRAEGIDGSTFITAAAGNGCEVGIQISGHPKRWFKTSAEAPIGNFEIDLPNNRALGAIGDSAIVDAFGLGAMTQSSKPPKHNMKRANNSLRGQGDDKDLSTGEHPYFSDLGIKLGLNARRIVAKKQAPAVSLGIIDRKGELGRLGGGIYKMPLSLFETALEAAAK